MEAHHGNDNSLRLRGIALATCTIDAESCHGVLHVNLQPCAFPFCPIGVVRRNGWFSIADFEVASGRNTQVDHPAARIFSTRKLKRLVSVHAFDAGKNFIASMSAQKS
jgi:hypothetical protein